VNALDVADYIVEKTRNTKFPVTHMKLQKMLYFAWIEYYKRFGKELFADEFYAWKYGPVVSDVYSKYCIFGARKISFVRGRDERMLPSKEVAGFLDDYIESCQNVSAGDLVLKSHRPKGAWQSVYNEGQLMTKIPHQTIVRLECR